MSTRFFKACKKIEIDDFDLSDIYSDCSSCVRVLVHLPELGH